MSTSRAFPSEFPIFPLPDVVLFPETALPLHVFEPRYRALATDAIAGERVIGMVLVRPGADPMQERAPIFDVGCAGRMSEIRALPDGRFTFTLHGERRFRIRSERLELGGYRSVEAELLDDPGFAQLPAAERARLEAGRKTLEARVLELVELQSPPNVEPLRMRFRELDPLALVRGLAFALQCEPTAKQGLLTAPGPCAQLELLIQLSEFLLAEARLPAGASGPGFVQ